MTGVRRRAGFAETLLVGAEFGDVLPLVEGVIEALGQEDGGHYLARMRRLRMRRVAVVR